MTRDCSYPCSATLTTKDRILVILGVVLELAKFKLLPYNLTETEITEALSPLRRQSDRLGRLSPSVSAILTAFAVAELSSPASAPSSEKQSPMAQPSPATPNSPVAQPAPPQPLQLQGHENR